MTYWHEPRREDGCALRGVGERVEIDAERAAELVQVLENLDRGPADGRFLYWECRKPYFLGLRHGVERRYARTWGGTDGLQHTEWYFETQDLWCLSQFPGEVRGMEHRPIEVGETPVLRRSSLDRRSTS
ncbi:hypothetical protein [Lentzea nigeriaca]|uniref:hypothetical protein n=1 Tax=Lentzea nigeriaca TaxID=1128665 RepID=UPI00195D6AB2|nr:hypothetical protein [Lentzea nigeriaca]MBM7864266.1 hypothetical protein [Lentzea nigeriaca]